MGCLLSKGFFKNDEVVPVTIRPLSFTPRKDIHHGGSETHGLSVHSSTGRDRAAPDNGHPQKQVVLTTVTAPTSNGTSSPSPLKQQSDSVGLTNQDRALSTRDTAGVVLPPTRDEDGGKGVSIVTNQIDAGIVTNQNEAGIKTNQKDDDIVTNQNDADIATNQNEAGSLSNQDDVNHVTSDKDGGILAEADDTNTHSSPAKETAATVANSENGPAHGTSDGPTDGNDAVDLTSASPEAPAFQMPEVEIQKVPDGEGCPITLGKFFGVWTVPWPSLPAQIMRAQYFTFDDSDVILTGYAKSGSHWVWEMVHMLMTGRAQHCRTPKERLMFSFSTQEFFDTLPPPRVFNTHAPFEGFPAAIRDGVNRCKIIYLLRNPKDLAVSYYHHLINQVDVEYEGNFHGYLDLFLEGKVPGGSWFDYVLGWEQKVKQCPDLPILVLHYEDVKEDTLAALQKLSEFLGVERDTGLLRDIADQCTIGKMKAVDEELKDKGPSHVNLSKTGKNFILRKGEVGDWQNWFSEDDDRRFMDAVQSKLQDSNLHFRYLLGNGGQEGKEEKGANEEKAGKEGEGGEEREEGGGGLGGMKVDHSNLH